MGPPKKRSHCVCPSGTPYRASEVLLLVADLRIQDVLVNHEVLFADGARPHRSLVQGRRSPEARGRIRKGAALQSEDPEAAREELTDSGWDRSAVGKPLCLSSSEDGPAQGWRVDRGGAGDAPALHTIMGVPASAPAGELLEDLGGGAHEAGRLPDCPLLAARPGHHEAVPTLVCED